MPKSSPYIKDHVNNWTKFSDGKITYDEFLRNSKSIEDKYQLDLPLFKKGEKR